MDIATIYDYLHFGRNNYYWNYFYQLFSSNIIFIRTFNINIRIILYAIKKIFTKTNKKYNRTIAIANHIFVLFGHVSLAFLLFQQINIHLCLHTHNSIRIYVFIGSYSHKLYNKLSIQFKFVCVNDQPNDMFHIVLLCFIYFVPGGSQMSRSNLRLINRFESYL